MKRTLLIVFAVIALAGQAGTLSAQSQILVDTKETVSGRLYSIRTGLDSLGSSVYSLKTPKLDFSVDDTARAIIRYAGLLNSPGSIQDSAVLTIYGYMDLASTNPALKKTVGTIVLIGRNSTSTDSVSYTSFAPTVFMPYWEIVITRGATAERDATLQVTFMVAGTKPE